MHKLWNEIVGESLFLVDVIRDIFQCVIFIQDCKTGVKKRKTLPIIIHLH